MLCRLCGSHAEREMEVHVGSNAEHTHTAAALHFLVVVGKVYADEAEAQVSPTHVAELGAVPAAAHTTIPDARREIRLDADSRGRERDTEPHGARDRGPSGRGIGGIGARRAGLQVDGERQQAAADQPERRVSTDGREALSGGLALPPRHACREGDRADAQRRATAPGVALAVITVRLGVVTADRDPGPALGAVP